ncbi:MAG TPA: hypothetical protein VEN81_01540, partial [Planctomycetota bacterium]|nr:hypothetical protein [Planctomycetota bacterium]
MASLILLAGCSSDISQGALPAKTPAPRPAVPARPPAPPPAPVAQIPSSPPAEKPVPPPNPSGPASSAPVVPSGLDPAVRAPQSRYLPPPFKPWGKEPAPSAPCFTFHTMDHLKAYVLMNGERIADTSCLWAFSLAYEFDPKIPVGAWPPPTATLAGRAWARDDGGRETSSIEIAIEGGAYDEAGRARLKKEYPH